MRDLCSLVKIIDLGFRNYRGDTNFLSWFSSLSLSLSLSLSFFHSRNGPLEGGKQTSVFSPFFFFYSFSSKPLKNMLGKIKKIVWSKMKTYIIQLLNFKYVII